MKTTLYIDIETIPGDVKPSVEDIKAPSNYKDEAKIKAYKEDNLDKEYRKQSLDTTAGKILCLGYAIDDGEVTVLTGSEEDILNGLFEAIKDEQMIWVGHYILGFDFPFVFHASIKHGSKLKNLMPPRELVKDTMRIWNPTDYKASTSLDKIAKYLGLESSKGDLDGSKVYDYYLDDRVPEIAEYCRKDVELVREVYNKITKRV